MMAEYIPVLQALILIEDGTGIFASLLIALYYRTTKENWRVFILYVFFLVLTAMFAVLAISDSLVIAKIPAWWATLPIVRGHIGRGPIVLVELWMICRIYGRPKHG